MSDHPYEFPNLCPLWYQTIRFGADFQKHWDRFNEWWQLATGEAQTPQHLRMLQLLRLRAEKEAMGLLSSAIPVKMDGSPGIDFHDPEFAQRHPTLAAFLFQMTDDDGKKRKGSSLILFAEDGVFKAGLRENNLALSLWVSCQTVEGVWDALEAKLTEHPVPWRVQTVGGGTTRRKA